MAERETVCKHCKRFVKKGKCPACNTKDLTKTWKGIIVINDPKNSMIAQKLDIEAPGKYAIWVK